MKPVFATLLIVSLVLTSSPLIKTTTAPADTGYPCDTKCQDRCAAAKRCLDDCGICCQICKCVPSGTYGNKSECPCYQYMRNSKGTSKCTSKCP